MGAHVQVRRTAAWFIAIGLASVVGCAAPNPHRVPYHRSTQGTPDSPEFSGARASLDGGPVLRLASSQSDAEGGPRAPVPPADDESVEAEETATAPDGLPELIAAAQQANPRLRRLEQEASAAWARVPQVRSLPDPMVQVNVFGRPMMMGQMQQRGSFMVSQTIPWLKRLDAEAQQVAYEALSREKEVHAARLRITADVKATWYRLYLVRQRIRINAATSRLLESLVDVATERLRVGQVTQGDVLLAALELSRLEEERLTLEQQLVAATAALNRLLNRPAESPLPLPDELDSEYAPLDFAALRSLAFEHQPEIAAARLRTQATAWGIRVAALRPVPDVTLNYERMFMEPVDMGMNGNAPMAANRRKDPWLVGAAINIPLWYGKYAGMEAEATRQHFAAHAGVEETVREFDALLLDLLEQARAARLTAELYESSLLPQSRQVLEADLESYAQGRVEFDRVIADARNLLTLEVGYHRALADLATALARIEQAIGTHLNLPRSPVRGGSDLPEFRPANVGAWGGT